MGANVQIHPNYLPLILDLSQQVEDLGNLSIKVSYYEEITTLSGQISIPQGGTILFDQYQNGVDAVVCGWNGQPDFKKDYGLDVDTLDSLGNYTIIGGNLPTNPSAFIYYISIKLKDLGNLDQGRIVEYAELTSEISKLLDIVRFSGNYTVSEDESKTVFISSPGANNITATMPAPTPENEGALFTFATHLLTTGSLTILAADGSFISGAAFQVLGTQGDAISVISNGAGGYDITSDNRGLRVPQVISTNTTLGIGSRNVVVDTADTTLSLSATPSDGSIVRVDNDSGGKVTIDGSGKLIYNESTFDLFDKESVTLLFANSKWTF